MTSVPVQTGDRRNDHKATLPNIGSLIRLFRRVALADSMLDA